MKLMAGICTFNRKKVLEKSIESLKQVNRFEELEVCIFDDCSTEYDEQYLQSLLPDATIFRGEENLGPGQNAQRMYKYFNQSDSDILINADADLLYTIDFVEKVKLFSSMHDFFSTFNADTHPVVSEYDSFFVEKDRVGAAGCCLTKKIVQLILSDVQTFDNSFDDAFSEALKDNSIAILSVKNSLVQHIGWNGFNSVDFSFDYGLNFKIDSIQNAQIIENLLEENILDWQRNFAVLKDFVLSTEKLTEEIINRCGRGEVGYQKIIKLAKRWVEFKIKSKCFGWIKK